MIERKGARRLGAGPSGETGSRAPRLAALALAALAAGCVSPLPSDQGSFRGRLTLEWLRPDVFVFDPDPSSPLRFERPSREVIEPGRMLTDGGSIPRPLRAFRSFSPWGYAPAFIVHDWLFVQHHCGEGPPRTLEEAAEIMGEGIMALIGASGGPMPEEEAVVRGMLAAVRSPIARKLWDDGVCSSPEAIDERLARYGWTRRDAKGAAAPSPPMPAGAGSPAPGTTAAFTFDFDIPCEQASATVINPTCPGAGGRETPAH